MENNNIFLPNLSDSEDKSSPLINRIRKNYRHIRKWAKRTETDCFRIYDNDIKEFPVTIDFYSGRILIYYFSSKKDQEDIPKKLKEEIEESILSIFEYNPEIYWKTRLKRKETEQYEKVSDQKDFFNVTEYGIKFIVNLQDYLDTGLFLDHRETRRFVASMSKEKRVLNLFSYTCSFSVHAAVAGSKYTKSVDLSNTYSDWGRENFILNSLSTAQNDIVRADCLKFLEEEVKKGVKYDIIVIDPPTLSRSKKMDRMFNVQLDYSFLIEKALQLLSEGGLVVFSTNLRKFKFDKDLFPNRKITDITAKTIPEDFRNEKIHSCWLIQ